MAGIPISQKRISLDKWHQVSGGLISMAIVLPGARVLFSHIKEALHHVEIKRLVLTRAVHQDLEDFRWLAEDLSRRPTILSDLVPLHPMMDIYHNASEYMCGG